MKFTTLAATAFLLSLVAACGQQAKSGPTPTAAAAAAPREIKLVASNAQNEMKFDQTALTATQGEEIKLTLTSAGTTPKMAMGHNFVLLKPGVDLDDFAMDAAGAPATGYIPDSFKAQVVANTKILGPGESDTITFKVPMAAGVYVFICSFPGHAAGNMKGTFTVK